MLGQENVMQWDIFFHPRMPLVNHSYFLRYYWVSTVPSRNLMPDLKFQRVYINLTNSGIFEISRTSG